MDFFMAIIFIHIMLIHIDVQINLIIKKVIKGLLELRKKEDLNKGDSRLKFKKKNKKELKLINYFFIFFANFGLFLYFWIFKFTFIFFVRKKFIFLYN